jgi:gas vesicle protein
MGASVGVRREIRKYGGIIMKSFLLGLGFGIGLGVLFAPMSGEETRENLSERASDLANTARDSYEQGRERVQRGVEQVKATAGRAMSQVRTGTESSLSSL